jgi:hypothetical protein
MLERTVISQNSLDLPAVAEALVYYGHVEVIFTCNDICNLIEKIGIENTIRLAESDLITILYEFENSVIMSQSDKVIPHSIGLVKFFADKYGKMVRDHHDEISILTKGKFGTGAPSKKDIRRLTNSIFERQAPPNQVRKAVLEDLKDDHFFNNAMRLSLKSIIPDYPNVNRLSFQSFVNDEYFDVRSNIDFDLARKLHPKAQTGESDISYALLVSPIVKMRSEMFHSGDRSCDIWSDELQSSLLVSRVNSYVDRLENKSNQINRFENYVFQGRSFSEAVNSGSISIIDILDYCESKETRKFKNWIKNLDNRSDFLSEYEKSRISESSLLNSIPFKTVKYLSLSALGLFFGNAAGPGLLPGLASNFVTDVIDDFMLSKLKIGWRPNHWVSQSRSRFFG